MIGIHIGAGAIVDRLARDAAIVGVHHPVDEAQRHPLGHKLGLPSHDAVQQAGRSVGVRIMPGQRVIGQRTQRVKIAARGMDLKGAHADMARGHTGQDRAGQGAFAIDRLAGGDGGKGACGGHAHRLHRFADHIFAQHRAQPGPAIPIAGIGRGAGAFQLDVIPALCRLNLAQQDRAAIAQLRVPVAELVACVELCQRGRAVGDGVSGKGRKGRVAGEPLGVDAQIPRQRVIARDPAGGGHRGRVHPGEHPVRQAGVAVVEGDRRHQRPRVIRQ